MGNSGDSLPVNRVTSAGGLDSIGALRMLAADARDWKFRCGGGGGGGGGFE